MSAIGALLFLIVHAIYVSIWAKPAHSAASAGVSGAAAARIPERVPRHNLSARLFHAIMALSMLALLFTAFLPKVGVQFPWVTYHWIAGIVLTISVIYHIFHAFCWISGPSGRTRKTSRTPDGESSALWGKPRPNRGNSPSIRWRTSCIT